MSEQRQLSYARTWGCLGWGMLMFGIFFIVLFEGVGGTEYTLEYTAAALIVGGLGILLVLIAKRLGR